MLSPAYRGASLGSFALVFLAAFEALAVATVMPEVSADLDGRAWFATAFSATLAASLVGMVLAGSWSDRRGAVRPLLTAVALFGVGLLVAGLAPSMGLLVLGRVLQGLGGGALTVALYVLVAQVYAPPDRPRILGLFALAWVLPGLVGPFLAGVVAETVGWRWVFLGVVGLAAAALTLMVPALAGVQPPPAGERRSREARRRDRRRVGLALVVALALLGLNGAGGLTGPLAVAGAAGALVAVVAALRPLLPAGTLRAGRGVAAVVALRGLVAATFFASEAYLPYLLQEQYDLRIWLSGLVLTGATLGWAAASQVQARLGDRLPDEAALRAGSSVLAAGVTAIAAATALGLPALLLVVGWVVAAAGMGLMYPRTTVAVLARTSEADRGSGSAGLTLADAVGSAAAVAVAGLVFTAVGTADDRAAFVAVLTLTTALGALAVVVARRA
nr:MFS transporter [Nocardioides perillae]